MSRPISGLPRPPLPREEYSKEWADDLVRMLAQLIDIMTNPGQGRNTFLVLTALPDSDVGLEPGTLYKSGNDVKITVANIAAPSGASLTISPGTVTISTP